MNFIFQVKKQPGFVTWFIVEMWVMWCVSLFPLCFVIIRAKLYLGKKGVMLWVGWEYWLGSINLFNKWGQFIEKVNAWSMKGECEIAYFK